MNTGSPHHEAVRLIQAGGASATAARVQVLRLLLAAHTTASHQTLMQAAMDEARPLDKVTLYRVLDWLVAQGLAHSVTGQDRVRRFSAVPIQHGHAHFECDAWDGCSAWRTIWVRSPEPHPDSRRASSTSPCTAAARIARTQAPESCPRLTLRCRSPCSPAFWAAARPRC